MRILLLAAVLFAGQAFAHDDHAATGHEREPAAPVPVETTAAGAVYGAVLPKDMPAAVGIDVAVKNPADYLGKTIAFSGEITQVCKKKGCWLVLTGADGGYARVAMHDHAFGVPTDSKGPAIVYGTLSEKVFSQAEIDHLREDGATAPAERELNIDALSVVIPQAG
ncbi:MAG TPA: DUF4920 domain-containing protein [Dokdonella sp.]|uniref:DUF4920 domain-containing protein n=1 Tax=Dokdonella sp. TaxID=2291710 RepID=UPI0025BC98D4|nr:DUF4920 domain-containing protein [Dokdonella sp.]MBX3691932.1 DUF4920 domain-containing protein [Dokdonella sp.]MCW5568174.1 DUF4920 domain-containing protein [Dokdonella sp.]HNR91869.1 DUF4920 domain-containing protein [Dokdonella sp.]